MVRRSGERKSDGVSGQSRLPAVDKRSVPQRLSRHNHAALACPRKIGHRSQRFAFYAENGVVKDLQVEKPGAFEVSSAESMLAKV